MAGFLRSHHIYCTGKPETSALRLAPCFARAGRILEARIDLKAPPSCINHNTSCWIPTVAQERWHMWRLVFYVRNVGHYVLYKQCSNYGKIMGCPGGCPTGNQVTISGCPSKLLIVRACEQGFGISILYLNL